jgi:MFS family permease
MPGTAVPAPGAARIKAVFLAQSLAGGSIVTRIADFQSGLGLSESALGLVLLGPALGGLLTYLAGGRMTDLWGTRAVILWSLPSVAVLELLNALAPGPFSLFLAGLAFSVPWSLSNIAMNVEADRHEAATGRRIMNACHGWWSAGMLATALIAVLARGAGLGPALHFALILPLVAVLSLVLVWPMAEAPPRGGEESAAGAIFAWPTLAVVAAVFFGLSGGFAQVTTQSWGVIFMRDSYALPDWADTAVLPAFLVALTLGRLFADGWNARFGTVRTTIALTGLAVAGAVLVTFSPHPLAAFAGFTAIGLGTCSLYPVMITSSALIGDRSASANVSAVNLVTNVAMFAAPLLTGLVAETLGIRSAFALILPALAVTLLLTRPVAGRA